MSLTRRIVIVIIAILIALAVGAGVYFGYRYGWFKSNSQDQKEYMYAVDEFTVNLDEPNYNRYMKVTISIGSTSKKLDAELAEKMPKVKDIINSILRSKKIEDVDTAAKTEVLKKEIIDKINFIFSSGRITNVYFTDIIIQ